MRWEDREDEIVVCDELMMEGYVPQTGQDLPGKWRFSYRHHPYRRAGGDPENHHHLKPHTGEDNLIKENLNKNHNIRFYFLKHSCLTFVLL